MSRKPVIPVTGRKISGKVALPVRVIDGRGIIGGAGDPVYVVTDEQLASGEFTLAGGEPEEVASVADLRKLTGGAATPVYVVSGSLGGAALTDISVPDLAFADWPPFDVKQRGNTFLAYTSGGTSLFDLQTYAGITVTTTYYVDTVNGDDANDGSEANPFATWNQAAGQADVDRIIIKDGSYITRQNATTTPSRSVEIIGQGTVYFTSDQRDRCSDWALTGGQTNTYETAVDGGNFVAAVYDESVLNASGYETGYTSQASIAAVESNPGSFYWTGGTLYVHPVDSRALSGNPSAGNLRLLDSLSFAPSKDNLTYYIEGIIFRGDIRARNSTSTGGFKFFMKGCDTGPLTLHGLDECILQGHTATNTPGDCANYDVRNTIATTFAEIDCTMGDHWLGNSSSQASTGHNGCLGVRVGGTYRETGGQVIADVTGCTVWMLGCALINSDTEIGYIMTTGSGGEAWLDTCTITGCDTDLTADTGHTINYRNLTSGGVFTGLGTIQPY